MAISRRTACPLDVFENEEAYLITAALPGAKSSDFEIHLEDDVLSIMANLSQAPIGEGFKARWRELRFGRFQRQLRLPVPIHRENIHAEFADGLLSLTLPKAEHARVHQIPVLSQR